MEIFQGYTANKAWNAAAVAFNASHLRSQGSRLGPTREISQAVFAIENPRQRWVHSRTPPANIALALAEVVWIVAGRSDTRFLSAWSKSYLQYVSKASHQHDAYGHRLRSHFGVDQLTRAAAVLSNNPQTRQVVLQLWDASMDLPLADGSPANANIPCNVLSMLKVRDGHLEWTQILRSNDFFRGTPYNFFQFIVD
jgi:thymidylate synthase